MNTDDYLTLISRASNKYGDKLMDLMNRNKKCCLKDITFEEAKEYYEKFIKNNE